MATTEPLNNTTGFYQFFVDSSGDNDRSSTRFEAARESLEIIRAAMGSGRLVDIIIAVRTANQLTVEATRRWINDMIAFSKLWLPSFEASETLFPPGSSDAVVTFDENLKICVFYTMLLGENMPGEYGLTPASIFSKNKLELVQNSYKTPGTQAALSKLKNGEALNNADRQALSSLFKLVKECLSSLSSDFTAASGAPGGQSASSPVSIDQQALTALLTQTNNAHTRYQDRLFEQTQHLYDPSRFM